jgi:hypothetical protein
MSLFADILDVHTDWLSRKGFDQQGLGLIGTNEDLLNRLEDALFNTICDKKKFWARKPLDINLNITGHFGPHQQELINFHFHYVYYPKRPKLNLLSFQAEWKGITETWLITDNRQHLLPRSEQAYHQLHYQANIHQINRAIVIPTNLPEFRPRVH